MLTNDYGQKWTKRFKQSFFNTQMTLMSNRIELPLIVHFLACINLFWANSSIFFIDNPLTPQIFNQIFKFSLMTTMSQKIGISVNVFRILLLVMNTIIITLYVIHMRSNLMNNVLTKMLIGFMQNHLLWHLLTFHLAIVSLQQLNSQSTVQTLLINITYAISNFVCTVIVGGFVYFKIRPFRKKSIFWNFSNNNQFYSYCLNLVRVIIITTDKRTVSFLIISFVMQIFLRRCVNQYFTKQSKKIRQFSSNLTLSVHLSLLINDFTNNSDLSTQILCFLVLICFINSILSFYSLINEQRYFPLCSSNVYEYYDFYYNFIQKKIKGNNKSKLSLKKDSQSDKILTIHILNCLNKQCKIKNIKLSQQTYCEDLQNIINQFIMNKSTQNQTNQLIHQIWKFQTGNKYKFRMQSKQISLVFQFIIYYALNISRLNQKSDSVNQQNIKSLKNIFYDKLQNCLQCFSLFYQQITKTQPKLDTILCVGNDIKKRTLDLKTMYAQLLKHSVINFKTAEVYVQFENYFLKQNNMNQQSIDRLRKIQKSKQADHIQQIYLPTLTAYSQTGLIQNMNTQCLSFFRLTRFQIKSKNLGSLIYPQITSHSQIKQKIKSNKNQKLYTFFKKRDQVVFGSISIKQRYIQNKKFDVVSIQKNGYSDYKNVILIRKDNHQIQTIQKQQTYIRPNLNYSTHLTLKWRYLYKQYLQKKIQQLVNQKIIKIRIQQLENSLFVMNLEENLHDQYLIVNIKVIKDIQKKKNRVSSFMINKPQVSQPKTTGKFHFFYDIQQGNSFNKNNGFHLQQTKLCLYGMNSQYYRFNSTLKKTKSLGKLQKDLSNMLITNTLLQQNRYTRGIKTYRLWEKQLYNIDLEDKDKYVQMFQDKIINNQDQSEDQSNQTDLYIMTGIFAILVILIGLSIGYNSLASSIHDHIVQYYSNGFKIQQLRLQMNRLCSITRDVQDGRYNNLTNLNWKDDLLKSYARLKDLRYQSLLFQSQQILVPYRNINYTGTLNEVIDVMISHVYQMTLGIINGKQIQYFHTGYIADINPRIITQKNKLASKLQQTAANFNKIQQILLIVGVICIFLFYVLLGLLIVVLNNSAKKKLKNLLMMSDNEARMNQTMADKLKYAVDMIKKNFDFDLKAILGPSQHHRQRKKSKQPIIGIQKKLLILLSLVIGFIVHFVIYYNFTNQMSTVLKTINLYQYQGQSLIQTYSVFSQVTNKMNHFGIYDLSAINNLRQKVNFLNLNRLYFDFYPQTNNLIDSIFYQNSCQLLNQHQIFANQTVVCQNSLPNYIVQNPFQLGMVAYFSKAHYNVFDNITQTYGCTGIYSGPFVKIFTLIADKIRSYGLDYIEDSFNQLTLYNLIYTIMSAFYAFLTLAVIYFLKSMNKQINQLLKFLNYNQKNHSKKKKKQENGKRQQNKKDTSSYSQSSQRNPLNNQHSEHQLSQDNDKISQK